MSAITDPTRQKLRQTRARRHGDCLVCSQAGLGLEFQVHPDGRVSTCLDCRADWGGYDGMVHGGVISTVADAVMTNCLFAHGIEAVTAELTVRFRHPVRLGSQLQATAWIRQDADPLYLIEAEMVQQDRLCARARAKFMRTGPEAT